MTYRINERVELSVGYQVYGLDMAAGTGTNCVGFNGELHGPALGVTLLY